MDTSPASPTRVALLNHGVSHSRTSDVARLSPDDSASSRPAVHEPAANMKGCDPVGANATCYFLATLLFIMAFNIPQMTALPWPLAGNMLPAQLVNSYTDLVVVALVMWGFHYLRRFTEVLFVHSYERRQSVLEAVGASVYYGFFGLWIGWAANYHRDYYLPHPALFYPGVFLFVVGEAGNCVHHVILMLEKKQEKSRGAGGNPRGHVIPTGLLFDYVSCPHYLFEIVTWLGFFIATLVLPALIFAVASTVTLIYYAKRNHKRYRDEFPDYPASRAALVPFIF